MPDDLSGVVLDGRYKVIAPIAEGAMGVVYRAERVKLGRIVAVKILHDQLPSELSSRKRFEIEAVAMAKLEHPHCAAVLDVGVHEDKPYVVMDFVSGENLKDVIAQGPLPIPRAVEIVRQVLSGLAHAHELGIIHRDIKPANVVLSQKAGLGDHVKILDFGLARLSADASNLTTGIVVGTPSYMAPEQIRGVAIDTRTDLYACGVLMFELLTGKKPFHSAKDDPIEVCSMHLKKPPPRLADMLPGVVFGELEAVVAKALAKTPDTRYSTAEEFAAALDIVPRRRTATPIAGVPMTATESGWAVPDPATGPTAVPKKARAPSSGPTAVPQPTRAPTTGPTRTPVSAAGAGSLFAPSPPPAPPGLPPTFDLSAMIPSSPTAASAGFDLAVSPPVPVDTPILEDHEPPDNRVTVAFAGAPPAGPSPLRTADAPATHERSMPLPAPVPRRPHVPLSRNRVVLVSAGVIGVVLIVAIVAGTRSSSQSAAVPDATGIGPNPPPPKDHPTDDALAHAQQLATDGKTDQALQALVAARRQFPDDPRLAYLAGKLYFGKLWWTAGLKQFRDTLRLDPGYRSDPELIKTVLKGFIFDESRSDIGEFLRVDIGAPAKPYLEETANTHPRAATRARATAELKRMQ